MTVSTSLMTYDDALREFLTTRSSYGGGLSNHGPMSTEALDHMDAAQWIGPFVTAYPPRLEPRTRPPERGGDWRRLLAEFLPDLVASLQRSERPHDTLDQLAMRALEGYLANEDFLARFALLHGVTVSTMARVLVGHLDEPGQRRLEAAVAGFVAAAAVAFDRRLDTSDAPAPPVQPDLAHRAGASLDDHTIKFTDACLGLADRTGTDLPLRAAELQIQLTT